MVQDVAYDDIKIGDSVKFTKTITQADVTLYAGISGDFNPVHMDKTYAETTQFKKPVVHGMLTAGLISAAVGTGLPGIGTIAISQTLKFMAPVFIDDTITATAEVITKDDAKHRVTLHTYCTNQDGVVVLDGESIVLKK